MSDCGLNAQPMSLRTEERRPEGSGSRRKGFMLA